MNLQLRIKNYELYKKMREKLNNGLGYLLIKIIWSIKMSRHYQ